MSVHTPNRRRSIKAARASHRHESERPTLQSDLIQLRSIAREARKHPRGRKASTKRPGSDKDRAARELADRPTLPLNERQQALYDLLTDYPQRPVDLRKTLGLTGSQIGATMGGLTARGLAIRTPQGWRRDAPP